MFERFCYWVFVAIDIALMMACTFTVGYWLYQGLK